MKQRHIVYEADDFFVAEANSGLIGHYTMYFEDNRPSQIIRADTDDILQDQINYYRGMYNLQ